MPQPHPCLLWGREMKKKTITLISDNEGSRHWDITLHIGRAGAIYNGGYIAIHTHKQYYSENNKKIRKRSKDWNKENKERKAEKGHKWYRINKEAIIKRTAEWCKGHKNKRKIINSRYARKNSKKMKARRRQLGFIPLNNSFPNAAAHHVDINHIIYIPDKIHRSNSHNLKTGRGMPQINAIAFRWLFKEGENDK